MDKEITFSYTLTLSVLEIISYSILFGAIFCLLLGIIFYKFDVVRFFKEKM
ncbi:hypothetical protein [Alysiella crassa]|uniref:Uncharacterized protein n=1 Tax=Alysiella crassa TaxID=153491 RepID=A0A376BW86_9NEIS|nr:hypothetical protein [Alysiella crassa]UOP06542.1 hypothetical protein LVJ80_12400 [Alysiella crassa]SSY81075.1 Uncharacterised protein [Alysiella crassa]